MSEFWALLTTESCQDYFRPHNLSDFSSIDCRLRFFRTEMTFSWNCQIWHHSAAYNYGVVYLLLTADPKRAPIPTAGDLLMSSPLRVSQIFFLSQNYFDIFLVLKLGHVNCNPNF